MWNDSGAVAIFNTLLLVTTTGLLAAWLLQLLRRRGHAADCEINHWQITALGLLVVLFAFFTVNKQLDLQTYLTEYLRGVARRDGWYAERRQYQFWFVIAAAAVCGLGLFGLMIIGWRWSWPFKLAFVGICLYGLFALLRLFSFSHTDAFLATRVSTIKISRFLEPLGPMLVSIAALAATLDAKRNPN